jgi:molybdopterin molybdotransferase
VVNKLTTLKTFTILKKAQLIKVEDALEIILGSTEDFGVERVDLEDSLGRVLKEPIRADRDLPPFNRVSMDGIAIRHMAFEEGRRTFKIEGVQAAGSPQLELSSPNGCLEVMTGAVLPNQADVVVPYEMVSIENGFATVETEDVASMQNVHLKGLDRKENELLVDENRLISPAEIGVLATVGIPKVKVAKLPRTAIISTGDELVDVDQTPLPHQIRMSNVHSLKALIEPYGIHPDLFHLVDDPIQLKEKISELLSKYDILMFSGAVSKGKFDYLPQILKDLEVKKLFHRVRQRPGKPFWFGKRNQATVFAYPGNPVSTFVSCTYYFIPWLRKSLGLPAAEKSFALLDSDFQFKPVLTYFLQVKLVNRMGVVYAIPEAGNGSGDLANLTLNDAFLKLDAERDEFKKGEVFPYFAFRQLK